MKFIFEYTGRVWRVYCVNEYGAHEYCGHLHLNPEQIELLESTLKEGVKRWMDHEVEVEFQIQGKQKGYTRGENSV